MKFTAILTFIPSQSRTAVWSTRSALARATTKGSVRLETLCSDYRRSHDVEVRIARIFNTYGPGMATNDGRVVSNFILQTLRGEPVTVYGNGSQTRSFCYRDDLIEGLVRLMALDGKEPRPVNLGIQKNAACWIWCRRSREHAAVRPR